MVGDWGRMLGRLEVLVSILSIEFIRTSIHDALETDVGILSKAKARASLSMNGKDNEVYYFLEGGMYDFDQDKKFTLEVKLKEEETTYLKDRLLPTVIGLLSKATQGFPPNVCVMCGANKAKLPSVMRIYQDTLTTDVKGAIKTAVAELLLILITDFVCVWISVCKREFAYN
ncbi:hypothetical protein Ahy_A01g002961 [Arachis hypogaea]|uniref:Uncharacterized protein n=1 Tax=Arachis hypogaea TaxID=3818 RepID=A0A445ERX0_ARAHY|nr:hypothetical protein Ahy_A01g002961 [Arachis hypogaea]